MIFNELKVKAYTSNGENMKQNCIRYFLNLILFIAISLFNTQLIPFLKEVGYSSTQRNMILAVNASFSILLQILFGYLCDRYKSMKKFFYLSYALLFLFGVMMFMYTKKQFFLHMFLTSMMASMVKVLTALIETWMLFLNQKEYGKYRSLGAIGLCVGSPLAGFIVDTFSYQGIIWTSVFVSVLTLLSTFFTEDVEYKEKLDFQKLLSLFKNKEYMYMMVIYVLIYIVGTADQYVVIDKMLKLKASSFTIGIKWAIQSLMEIPFFLFAQKLLKKYSPYKLLGIGIIMYGIKFALYGFSNHAWWIIATSTLQIVTLPVVAYTSKIIFSKLCPEVKASSQMIAMAAFIGGSAFITPLLTAYLLPKIGYNYTLYAFAIFTILPFLLLLFKNRVVKKGSML